MAPHINVSQIIKEELNNFFRNLNFFFLSSGSPMCCAQVWYASFTLAQLKEVCFNQTDLLKHGNTV